MHMKVRFQYSELQAILAAEVTRRLNRPIAAIDIITWDTNDEEMECLDAVELEFELEEPDLLSLITDEQEPQPA